MTTRTIKRYSNRKLYDTQDSHYVTLQQIAGLIRNGDEIRVIDKTTQQDLTAATMAQIIFEERNGPRLPVEGLAASSAADCRPTRIVDRKDWARVCRSPSSGLSFAVRFRR